MKISLLFLVGLAVAVVADEIITTNAGAPVDDARNSDTVGRRGPILLQDAYLIERLQIHNRERIPERNVHARGAVAKGYFQPTANWENATMAKVFHGTKRTPIACRWSSVIHGVGSPEFLRDPRGFALKFYSEEGNYDIVGLNFPVFFIRDGIRFPEMIRSLKPSPKSGVQEWRRIFDYFSHYPESTHMFTWLLDDQGIPLNYRQLDGFGVHTFKWINADGKSTLVRYYWRSEQGIESLMDDQAVLMPFSNHTFDLYENIRIGNYPRWKFYVQRIPDDYDAAVKILGFDPLDTTKQWPESAVPYEELGELVFDENPTSQYLENEQIAFSPARMVPGIEPSDEKMLQTRLFSYVDTQRYRLGVNYQMLPINKPKCPFHDGHVGGHMNMNVDEEDINYFPSSIRKTVHEAKPFPHDPERLDGTKVREMIPITDDFTQAGEHYRSFDAKRQDRFAMRTASALSGNDLPDAIRNTWLEYFTKADAGMGAAIKHYLSILREHSRNPAEVEALIATGGVDGKILDFAEDFFRASGSRP